MCPTYSTSLHVNKVGKESERTRHVMKGNKSEESHPAINEKQSLGKTEASCENFQNFSAFGLHKRKSLENKNTEVKSNLLREIAGANTITICRVRMKLTRCLRGIKQPFDVSDIQHFVACQQSRKGVGKN